MSNDFATGSNASKPEHSPKSLGLVNPLDVIVQARLALSPKAFDKLMLQTNRQPTIDQVLEAIEQDPDCD